MDILDFFEDHCVVRGEIPIRMEGLHELQRAGRVEQEEGGKIGEITDPRVWVEDETWGEEKRGKETLKNPQPCEM